MGLKLDRQKKRNFIVSLFYLLSRLPFFSKKTKLQLFLNLEWISDRLSHEFSYTLYPPDQHPIRKANEPFILNFIQPTYTVIDLGCNRGDIAFSISKKAKRVIGIDFDQTHIHAAMKNYTAPNLEFYCMDAAKYLAERSEKFDVLILSHILEHLDNPAQFVESFKNKFSYIYIEVPDFEKNYLNLYRQNLGISLIYSDNDHVFEFDRDEIAQLIAGANLEIISSEFRYGVQKYWCKVR